MIRLFVALEPPEEVRHTLRERQGGLANVRWIPPENFHLTLRFIGEVNEGLAAEIDAELATLAAPSFDLTLKSVGHFGSRGVARAIWAGAVTSPALTALQAKVEAAVARAGVPPERRKFHAHITLARLKRLPLDHLAPFLAEHAGFSAASFTVTHFSLMSSRPGREGAVYRAEALYPLRQLVPDPAFFTEPAPTAPD